MSRKKITEEGISGDTPEETSGDISEEISEEGALSSFPSRALGLLRKKRAVTPPVEHLKGAALWRVVRGGIEEAERVAAGVYDADIHEIYEMCRRHNPQGLLFETVRSRVTELGLTPTTGKGRLGVQGQPPWEGWTPGAVFK